MTRSALTPTWIESFLGTLAAAGFADADAAAAYRAFTGFLLGQLLPEVSDGASPGVDALGPDGDRRPPDTGSSQFPQTRRLAPELARDRYAEEFESGLQALLDRLAAR